MKEYVLYVVFGVICLVSCPDAGGDLTTSSLITAPGDLSISQGKIGGDTIDIIPRPSSFGTDAKGRELNSVNYKIYYVIEDISGEKKTYTETSTQVVIDDIALAKPNSGKGGIVSQEHVSTTSLQSYEISGLFSTKDYYVFVRAFNIEDESYYTDSEIIKCTTLEEGKEPSLSLSNLGVTYNTFDETQGLILNNTIKPIWSGTFLVDINEINFSIASKNEVSLQTGAGNEAVSIDRNSGVITVDRGAQVGSVEYEVRIDPVPDSTLYNDFSIVSVRIIVTGNIVTLESLSYPDASQFVKDVEVVGFAPILNPDGATAKFTVTEGSLPAGLVIDAQTGVISGTPTTIGEFSVTITATGIDYYDGSAKVTLLLAIRVLPVPSAPRNVALVAGDGFMRVSWEAPSNLGVIDGKAGSIVGYKVYYSEATISNTSSADVLSLGAGKALSLDVPGLQNGTKYYFVVTASNEAGESTLSDEVADTPGLVTLPNITGQFSYADTNLDYDDGGVVPLANQNLSDGTNPVTPVYAMQSVSRAGVDIDDHGISVDPVNGSLRIPGSLDAGSYVVNIRASSALTTGSVATAANVTIAQKDISAGYSFLAYPAVSTVAGTSADSGMAPIIGTLDNIRDLTFSIDVTGANANNITVSQYGIVVVSSAATAQGSETYEVTARGQGNYTGSVKSSVDITVDAATAPDLQGQIDLGDIAVDYGSEGVGMVQIQTPLTDGTNAVVALYAILSSGTTATGATVSAAGEVRIPDSLDAGTYAVKVQVTAAGTSGELSAESIVTVNQKDITGYALNYTGISTSAGTYASSGIAPVVATLNNSDDLSFTVMLNGMANENVTVNEDGIVSVASSALVGDAGNYEVSARGKGNYSGTVTAPIQIDISEATDPRIQGAVSLGDMNSIYGSEATGTVKVVTPLTDGLNAVLPQYNIVVSETTATGASVSNSGLVTIPGNLDVGNYRVTVQVSSTGTSGELRATAYVQIEPQDLTMQYNSILLEAIYDTQITDLSVTLSSPESTGIYSISPALPAGLNLDPLSGVISGTPSGIAAQRVYTVSYDASSRNYNDPSDVPVVIGVEAKSIATYVFTDYADLVETAGVEKISAAAALPGLTDTDVEYSIFQRPATATPSHVQINSATGAVTLTTGGTVADSGDYTVRARGIGNYTGTLDATIRVTVNP